MSGRDIISRINAELEAWECGPDAATWRADVALAPEVRPPTSGIQWGPARLYIDGEEVPATNLQWESVPADTASMLVDNSQSRFTVPAGGWYRVMAAFATWTPSMAQRWIVPLTNACESMAALAAAFRSFAVKPCGKRECFCHPEPFPAARDYRRRTKHRNRRRRP